MKQFLAHPRVRMHLKQGAKFAISGVVGATIEFSIIYILVKHYGFDPRVAYIPSGFFAVIFVFFFNKYVTFQAGRSGDHAGQTLRFVMVYALAFLLNYILAVSFFWIGSKVLPWSDLTIGMLAKAGAIGIVAFLNYFLSHGFIFRRHEI